MKLLVVYHVLEIMPSFLGTEKSTESVFGVNANFFLKGCISLVAIDKLHDVNSRVQVVAF